MKKSTKIWLLIAGAAVIIGAVFIVIAMNLGDVTGIYLDSNWKFHTLEKGDSETFDSDPLTGITEIDINMSNDGIVIRESEDAFVHVHVDSTYGGRASVVVEGGKLSISQVSYMRFITLNFDFSNMGKQDQVTVYLPKNNDVKIMTLETGDGNIEVSHPVNVNQFSVITSSGNIDVTNVTSEETFLKTSDGNIAVTGIYKNKTTVKTSSGNIDASGSFTGEVNMQTSDGNVGVHTDAERSLSTVEAKTSDGVVRINDLKVGSDYKESNGTKNTFSLKTSSGNINLDVK